MSVFSFADRQRSGRALRQGVSRSAHDHWAPRAGGRDVIAMLDQSSEGRLPHLAPVRFGRMLQNPLAFLRGAPAVMASDLAETPATGLEVQACGDCHLGNFGLFASPERNLVFDINDFDETLRATWEWDVKRLAASLVVAARVNGFAEQRCVEVAIRSVASYRGHMHEFADMSPLETWYYHIDADDLVANAADEEARRLREQMAAKARLRVGERLLPKITEQVGERRQFVESPPLTRAHARSGDAAAIGGYLGRGDQFDLAIGRFAIAYADQTERDHAALVQAHRTGRIVADAEPD